MNWKILNDRFGDFKENVRGCELNIIARSWERFFANDYVFFQARNYRVKEWMVPAKLAGCINIL